MTHIQKITEKLRPKGTGEGMGGGWGLGEEGVGEEVAKSKSRNVQSL